MTHTDCPVVVVVPGDLHLTEPDRDNARVAFQVVEEANALIRPDFVISGPDRVVVRVWSESPVVAVNYRIDEGARSGLEPSGDSDWSGPLPGDRLAKGEHLLEVVAVAADDTEGSHRVGFMVDPTGRYTAVPEARPVVTSTAFC
jgi:hypothetical protein